MRLSDHQAAFTQDVAALIRMAPHIMPNHRVRLSYAERSIEEQARLHDKNPHGAAPPGKSQHNSRLAVDLILDRRTETGWQWLSKSSHYLKLGQQWEMLSLWNRWGGRYSDGNHFERLTRLRPDTDILEA